jgi:hypothetical protein
MPPVLSYTNLELATPWTVEKGPSIAKIPPDTANIEQVDDRIVLYTSGPPYAGWLAKHVEDGPPISETLIYKFEFDMEPDLVAGLLAQGYEFDLMVTDADRDVYNLSNLIDVSKGGMWCVSALDGSSWAETGCLVGAVKAGEWNHIIVTHEIDPASGTSSPIGLVVNGVVFEAPEAVQQIPKFKLNWDVNLIVMQMQPGLNDKGGAYSKSFRNVDVTVGKAK